MTDAATDPVKTAITTRRAAQAGRPHERRTTMTMTMAQARQIALPHTNPTAVAYRARPDLAEQWQAESALVRRTYNEARRAVADAWYPHLAQTGIITRPNDLWAAQPTLDETTPAQARRRRWHWQLCSSVGYDHTRLRLPDCHIIATPSRCRGHAQAPDLRTRTGRAMQADLDALLQVPAPHLDTLKNLPADGSTPCCDATGWLLGRGSLLSNVVAPGWRYLVFEAPPAPAPDASLWESVPVAEYLAVQQEVFR